MIRTSSKEAFDKYIAPGEITASVIEHVKRRAIPMTRRQIAEEMGIATATISGIVKPLVTAGVLIEVDGKRPCPITGNNVFHVQHRDNLRGQLKLV